MSSKGGIGNLTGMSSFGDFGTVRLNSKSAKSVAGIFFSKLGNSLAYG